MTTLQEAMVREDKETEVCLRKRVTIPFGGVEIAVDLVVEFSLSTTTSYTSSSNYNIYVDDNRPPSSVVVTSFPTNLTQWDRFLTSLTYLHELKVLDLGNLEIDFDMVCVLGNKLPRMFNLETFSTNLDDSHGNGHIFLYLIQTLQSFCPSLRDLILRGIKQRVDDRLCGAIGLLFGEHPGLHRLTIQDSYIGSSLLKALSSCLLLNGTSSGEKVLRFDTCQLSDNVVDLLFERLGKNRVLDSIELTNTRMSDYFHTILGLMLPEMTNISRVKLKLSTPSQIRYTIGLLNERRPSESLKELHLVNTPSSGLSDVTSVGVVAEAVRGMHNLTSLKLEGLNLQNTRESLGLFRSLETCKKLDRLQISGCKMEDHHLLAIQKLLKVLYCLKQLTLTRGPFSVRKTSTFIGDALWQRSKLSSLHLDVMGDATEIDKLHRQLAVYVSGDLVLGLTTETPSGECGADQEDLVLSTANANDCNNNDYDVIDDVMEPPIRLRNKMPMSNQYMEGLQRKDYRRPYPAHQGYDNTMNYNNNRKEDMLDNQVPRVVGSDNAHARGVDAYARCVGRPRYRPCALTGCYPWGISERPAFLEQLEMSVGFPNFH